MGPAYLTLSTNPKFASCSFCGNVVDIDGVSFRKTSHNKLHRSVRAMGTIHVCDECMDVIKSVNVVKRRFLGPGGGSIGAAQYQDDPPLDEGIAKYVEALRLNMVDTFSSCEGGDGHLFAEPTIRFSGGHGEGFRAFAICVEEGFPVSDLRRFWRWDDDTLSGPWWEITFSEKCKP